VGLGEKKRKIIKIKPIYNIFINVTDHHQKPNKNLMGWVSVFMEKKI
jgi:hypothetical protein